MVEEISKSEKKRFGGKKCLNYCRKNPWVISTIALGIVVLVLMFNSFGSFGCTGNVISEEEASQKLLDLYTSQGIEGLSVSSVEKVSGVYQVNFDYQGQEVPSFLTLDGNMVGSLFEFPEKGQTQASGSSSSSSSSSSVEYTQEQNALIKDFGECLYEKGMRVYYADWCGHCHSLIETFGGLDNAGRMMIQCQNQDQTPGTGAELCAQENITGFPTIKINGERYNGARTFQALGNATGCVAPII